MWIWILAGLLAWVVTSAAVGLTLGRVVRARDHDTVRKGRRVATPTI